MSNTITATPATVARHARYTLAEQRVFALMILELNECQNSGCERRVGNVVWGKVHCPSEDEVAALLFKQIRHHDFYIGEQLADGVYEAEVHERAPRLFRLLKSKVNRLNAENRRTAIKEARLRAMGLYLK